MSPNHESRDLLCVIFRVVSYRLRLGQATLMSLQV